MVRWSEITAAFGGTFDPPHLGHREAVRGLFRNPGVCRVLILPAATPPHKQASTPAEHRVAMARLNFSSTPRDSYPSEVSLDLREVERAKTQLKPSYSFDTLQELKREFPKLAFVIGTDQLRELHKWYRFPEILTLCHWLVLARKPEGEAKALDGFRELEASGLIRKDQQDSGAWVTRDGQKTLKLVPTDAPALSSSEIRLAIGRQGLSPENSLFPDVLSYLNQHRLYGTQVEPKEVK